MNTQVTITPVNIFKLAETEKSIFGKLTTTPNGLLSITKHVLLFVLKNTSVRTITNEINAHLKTEHFGKKFLAIQNNSGIKIERRAQTTPMIMETIKEGVLFGSQTKKPDGIVLQTEHVVMVVNNDFRKTTFADMREELNAHMKAQFNEKIIIY